MNFINIVCFLHLPVQCLMFFWDGGVGRGKSLVTGILEGCISLQIIYHFSVICIHEEPVLRRGTIFYCKSSLACIETTFAEQPQVSLEYLLYKGTVLCDIETSCGGAKIV